MGVARYPFGNSSFMTKKAPKDTIRIKNEAEAIQIREK
jgi:hypothetical protein